MLKRVYIHNFRCFVNFELSLGQQQLILGLNGAGKSTLSDALRAVKALITGDAQPDVLFPIVVGLAGRACRNRRSNY
jgi:predicted ATPase